MATILGVVTEDARKYWPQFLGGILGITAGATVPGSAWNSLIKSFSVGEGGWINPGTGAVPRSPDAGLRRIDNSIQDLDAVVDPTRLIGDQRYAASSRASFTKALIPADFTFEAPSTLRVRCLLDFADFNDDDFNNSPEIWEIGLFSEHPTVAGQRLMVAYGTFPKETKTIGIQIENVMRLVF